jgi:S1-C subfamily serine protease
VSYDRDEWRRPWRDGDHPTPGAAAPETAPDAAGPDARPAAGAVTTPTITRFPQPPPAGWGPESTGPGSPAGSVRPPDTTGTVDAPTRERGRGRWLATLAVGLLGAVVGTTVTLAALLPDGDAATTGDPSAQEELETSPPPLPTAGSEDTTTVVPAVAEAVTPSVVRIDVTLPEDAEATPFGGGPALGSGVIYRSDGYILTNHHVIDGAQEVTVRLSDGEALMAEVIGSDELNDLAVVRIEREDLPAVSLRNGDDEVQVGETVIAIGSPFGLDASVTAGIVSALNRELQLPDEEQGVLMTIPSVIQTDAAINPGNSGGALVDANGQLVGINTAILSRSGASQGVGFAVSADQAISSADQLISDGFVRHPLLGITGNDVDPEMAEELDLPASRGAVVQGVEEGTGAAEADLRPGDIILEVDDEPLATMSGLVAEVRSRAPGDVVGLTVIRDGETLQVDVTLSERPR